MIAARDVEAALDGVHDPELDRPITSLGFVAVIATSDDDVRVSLRLPTYFCAPNFAWLMVADARDAVAALPGVGRVSVELLEHFVSAEINAGVAAVGSFDESFDADGSLEELRLTFERKAHLAAQERLARALGPAASAGLSLDDAALIAPAETAGVVRRRSRLGLQSRFAFCDSAGAALLESDLPGWLRFAQTVRVSIEGNAGFCRGLLETRYGLQR